MRYKASLVVQSEVEEDDTGVIITASGSSLITSNIVTLSFEDSPTIFKPGMTYDGKIKVLGPDGNPIKRKVVYLTVNYREDKKSVRKLITSHKGIAKFSLKTEQWGMEQVNIEAEYKIANKPFVHKLNQLTPDCPTADLFLQPFYSKSQSFIKFKFSTKPFKCNKKAVIRAQYLIRQSALAPQQQSIKFFYVVMNKGQMVHQGSIEVSIDPETEEHRGNLAVSLKMMLKLSPLAQMVLYTILPSGEAVADSMNIRIQPCLRNKVSLKFSASQDLPGHQASLMLNTAPGSLCSVRAVDQSLLMRPVSELNIQSVFSLLPVQELSGYPFISSGDESKPIWENSKGGEASKSSDYFSKMNVYKTFKDIGVKVLTNAEVKKPEDEDSNEDDDEDEDEDEELPNTDVTAVDSSLSKALVSTCNYFRETWIWDLVPVSESGAVALNKTVPDSITTWQAGAFCTSPAGFGVAPETTFSAFQPFIVILSNPCSVVEGEVFTLKATVISYIKSCMMMELTLAESEQYSVDACTSCTNTQCLCADGTWTIAWTITPLVLGEVNISVTVEALESPDLCRGKTVTVPQQGRVSSIIKSVQVQAEGSKESESYNELLCPSDVVEKMISLNLPNGFVEGSATASVSVLGDLMGRALHNLASLLAMPYGCGEQNMLHFATNIFILEYLESTNQLTSTIRSTAVTYLVNGYQRELEYKHTDGSYSAFGTDDESGNTWLTAFVMKSFRKAMRYIFVDEIFVDQANIWLREQQQANGCFASTGKLFYTDMEGGVNDEVTLSAYITAAMLELNYTVTDPVVDHSLTCLRNEYIQVKSTYTKALLFYTFTLAGDLVMRKILMLNLDAKAITSEGGRHWSREDDGSVTDSLEVEMTSYVLLALMSGPQISGFDLDYISSIVYWLSQQQNAFGGFASTQDTVVALQALAKYSIATYSPAGAITLTLTSPSGLKNLFNINQRNRILYQESHLQELPGDYDIRAEGEGCVYVQFTLDYNIPLPLNSSSFIISASVSEICKVPNTDLELTITVTYEGKRAETNMVVMEVKALSGFSVDEASVQLANIKSDTTSGAVKHVDLIEGKAIIYLNGLMKGEEKVYTLTLKQRHPIDNLKAAVVKVYDYYETGEKAATSYALPCDA